MKRRGTIIIMCMCMWMAGLSACGSQGTEDNRPADTVVLESERLTEILENDTENNDNYKNNESYENYTGSWAVDGLGHDEIIAGGGSELKCTVTDNNLFSGSMFTQQQESERLAGIDDISGRIENGELFFSFPDDGWGGTGRLHLQFADDKVSIEVLDYQMDEENATGYGISGSYKMVRSK